MQKIKNK